VPAASPRAACSRTLGIAVYAQTVDAVFRMQAVSTWREAPLLICCSCRETEREREREREREPFEGSFRGTFLPRDSYSAFVPSPLSR